MTHLNEQ